ncbi:DUF2500 domain-containing protein [Neobacillus piezotolerans]|uniref:DUF2500 domain-containing protein n=1 Tax=Neobacillus piezotolerans TaxID=2259171 RepID=A0A3D8GN71_9BACI|nr:DUF2500 domain-containing protein [Neobacillus piezotolerans]RDU35731.1 DUF2500 domain-containing protein [Neobacillus piezotolerans]
MGGFGDEPFFFSVFPVFFIVIFAIVIGVFLFTIVKGIGEWSSNNKQPRLTVKAVVVSKRAEVSGGSGDSSSSTWYYATFEVESGDRMELALNGQEYGLLAEGDTGELAFQGTRYLGFSRTKAIASPTI